MLNDFETLTDEELQAVVGGGTRQNIVDGISIGGALGGVKGAITGGLIGWAFTPVVVH